MKNVMVDLETLGTRAGCTILSIGAVAFDEIKGLGKEFYAVVSKQSCADAGLYVDLDTLGWWNLQSEEAQSVLTQAQDVTIAQPLEVVLKGLNKYLIAEGRDVKVWGNGADFDNPILINAYNAVEVKQGWGNWSGRCYRTLKSLYPNVPLDRSGTHHNALDDAKTQATHAIAIMRQKSSDDTYLRDYEARRSTVLS